MNEFEQRANRAVEHYRAIHLTNADRIRWMTDEELAHFMTPENYKFPCPPNHNDCQYELIPCWMCWARWIKAPVEVDNGT